MRCLQCGKEIPEGRKFCSSSCSAKYNNVRRQRHPWTEEQHEKNRKSTKQKYCKYCGKAIVSGTCCSDCKPFVQRVSTYRRLRLLDSSGSLKKSNQKLVSLLLELYFGKHLSLQEIWEKTGLRYRQVEIIFQTADIKLRSISNGVQEGILLGKRELPKPLEKRGIRGYHTSWEGICMWYRSSYELRFAQELDEKRIPYLIEDKRTRTRYWDSELGRYRVAVPDFHLLDSNELVEIKSSYTLGSVQRMKDKFTAYRAAGYLPKLLVDGNLFEI